MKTGVSVDQGLALLMVAERIEDETERRQAYRAILNDVRSQGYYDGGDDERYVSWG